MLVETRKLISEEGKLSECPIQLSVILIIQLTWSKNVVSREKNGLEGRQLLKQWITERLEEL